jgi:hypothetical protein
MSKRHCAKHALAFITSMTDWKTLSIIGPKLSKALNTTLYNFNVSVLDHCSWGTSRTHPQSPIKITKQKKGCPTLRANWSLLKQTPCRQTRRKIWPSCSWTAETTCAQNKQANTLLVRTQHTIQMNQKSALTSCSSCQYTDPAINSNNSTAVTGVVSYMHNFVLYATQWELLTIHGQWWSIPSIQ